MDQNRTPHAIIAVLIAFIVSFMVASAETITQNTLDPWKITGGTITTRSTSSAVQIPKLATTTSSVCLSVNASGTLVIVPCGSGGNPTIGGVTASTFYLASPLSMSATGTFVFTNPGYISTSTGLTVANFATTSISQFTNDSNYTTQSFVSSNYVPTSTALFLRAANNFSDLANTSTARTNLGLGSAATLASSTWLKVASNGSDINNTSTFRTNLGLGTAATLASSTWLKVANNGSDIASTTAFRTNLGLGTAATRATGDFLASTTTYVATNTGNWAGTWQGVNSSTFYLASNPSGFITSTLKQAYFLIESPSATEDDAFFISNSTATISKIYAVHKTNGDTATFNLGFGTSRATATSSVDKAFTSYQTFTATTTPTCYAVTTSTACPNQITGSSTIPTGGVMRLFTSAASSTQMLINVYYRD